MAIEGSGNPTANSKKQDMTGPGNLSVGYSSLHPQSGFLFAPLQRLVMSALRQYGDMNPNTVDGETGMMFIEFANSVVEDIRSHPYWDAGAINYYLSLEDRRPIPDIVVVAGLLSKYANQQASSKAKFLQEEYNRTSNRVLYNRKFGNNYQNAAIEISPFDKDANGYTTNGSVVTVITADGNIA